MGTNMISIGIVIAPYHAGVQKMLKIIEEEVGKSNGVSVTIIKRVSGSFEIPLGVKKLLMEENIHGIITLGAIERGETGHGIALANAVFPALIQLSLEFNKPVALGIIGPNATKEQIDSRVNRVALDALKALIGDLTVQ